MAKIPTVAIITSITDGYETLKRIKPQFGVEVEWIAVTDGKEEREPDHGWTIIPLVKTTDVPATGVHASPRDEGHPNRLAKIVKCEPWYVSRAPYTIWIDGAYRVTSPTFAVDAIKCANPIAQFVHPWRDCVFEEARASRDLVRYADQHEVIDRQANEYAEIGHPAHWGLWATGCIVRRTTDEMRLFGGQWLNEIRRWSYQDQISEPVILRFCDVRPSPLPGDHINNPWLSYEGSMRHG